MVTGQNVKNLLLFTRGASMESLFGAFAFAMFIAAHALAIAVVEPEAEDWPAFEPRPGRPQHQPHCCGSGSLSGGWSGLTGFRPRAKGRRRTCDSWCLNTGIGRLGTPASQIGHL